MNSILANMKKKVSTGEFNRTKRKLLQAKFQEESDEDDDEEVDTRVYEQEFVFKEMETYTRSSQQPSTSYMMDVDGADTMSVNSACFDIYNKFNFNIYSKMQLPIDSYHDKIIHMVQTNSVLVIEGPTGCGKTTQVPQFILDNCRETQTLCNIVVTQPRKIATINVAKRVCEERNWTMGTVCGYQVGLERKLSNDCILTYMTTGVLLQKLITTKHLNNYTHIIVDEVHERNQDLDFLLLIIRKFLFTNSPNTKVILMSATIDSKIFANYFRDECRLTRIITPAPILTINRPSNFLIRIFYATDIYHLNQLPNFDLTNPQIEDKIWDFFLFLIEKFDDADPVDEQGEKVKGGVLVFLPGIEEIERAHDKLTEEWKKSKSNTHLDIIPLHSSLPNDEQAKVFRPKRRGWRKVILATNIAESSITVPDISYVIDFCLTKTMRVDTVTKFCSLRLEWASQVNCDQRAGRVGRVSDGRVYRLVSRGFYEEALPKRAIPEMLTAPLERVVLQTKMLGLNDSPKQVLALALDPPNLKDVTVTILHLKEIGGLLSTFAGIKSDIDGDLTFLGKIMGSLPLDVHLSKLIVLGHMFNCLEETVIIAAGCSINNMFSVPFQQRFDAYKKVLIWADGSSSDLVALLNLYRVYHRYKAEKYFENHLAEQRWCATNMVSLKGLREWKLLVDEINERLKKLHVTEPLGQDKVKHTQHELALVLKVVTCGAFYPNYFIKNNVDGEENEREAVKVVGGRDPFRTVYLTGLSHDQPRHIYVRDIKRLMKDGDDMDKEVQIGFDGSSKIYVEFKKSDSLVSVNMDGFQQFARLSSKIPMGVYEAVRKRQLKMPFVLNILPLSTAQRLAKQYETTKEIVKVEKREKNYMDYNPLPGVEVEYITVGISNAIDAGSFWCQNIDDQTTHLLEEISNTLQNCVLHKDPKPVVGKLFATIFKEDKLFYRCKVLRFKRNICWVLFIDWGNTQEINISDLYALPDIPVLKCAPLAFDCALAGVQPSLKHNPQGIWSSRVNNSFYNKTRHVVLTGKVYSVVDDVVHLELFLNQSKESLNERLIKDGFAIPAEESFLSKDDHAKRLQVQKSQNPETAKVLNASKIVNYTDFDIPMNMMRENTERVYLKGPFSPLEMQIYGLVAGLRSNVIIEGNSVNAVLLDPDPQDVKSTLLVAAYVGQTESHRLKLRQTTLMPNIPGMAMLMTLLFCPQMEPKVSEDGAQVVSILCGLGCNEVTGKPIFPAHDLVLHLDTELTKEEIIKINQIRFTMNNAIMMMKQIYEGTTLDKEIIEIQRQLKTILFELIYLERNPMERAPAMQAEVWGENGADCKILEPTSTGGTFNVSNCIWPLLWFVELKKFSKEELSIKRNLKILDNMIKELIPFREIQCELCKERFFFFEILKGHFFSETHSVNERMFWENLQVAGGYESDD